MWWWLSKKWAESVGRMDGSSSSVVWMGGSCVEVVCPDRCLGFAMSERRLSAIEDMILREMEESCEVVDLLSSPCLASFRCYLLVSMPGCLRLRFSSAHSRPVCLRGAVQNALLPPIW